MNKIIEQAKDVLDIEAEGILSLKKRITNDFVKMVELTYHMNGRLIISGIGKSGIVARKIVATLNSTGTRAFFLHPVEAMHGDLGMVGNDDVFLAISYSGETDELNALLPSIRNIGCKIISFTGNVNSTLAKNSDIIIDVRVPREACPLGLAPTTSTTAILALGDALSVVLTKKKHFNSTDFKKFHPGGNLGARLSRRVKDFMITDQFIPQISINSKIENAIIEMDRLELGTILITNPDHTLAGIITDGDIRRFLVKKGNSFYDYTIDEMMTKNPRSVRSTTPAYDALNLMEHHQITVLPVTDINGKVEGILHLHDILGKGSFKFKGI